jgi:hypothetical protein
VGLIGSRRGVKPPYPRERAAEDADGVCQSGEGEARKATLLRRPRAIGSRAVRGVNAA